MIEHDLDILIHADQVYSHAGGSARLADIYLPTSVTPPIPVIIWLHGGGWRFGDRHLAPDLALFARRSGLAVVSIDYRLSDEATFPAPVEDVKTAVRWVRSAASTFGFDQHHIGLWGSSAGAHLAACAALSQEQDFLGEQHAGFSSAVQAVVDGYGPTNLARIDEDRSQVRVVGTDAESVAVGSVLPAGHPESFESRLIGAPLADSPEIVQLADPVHYMRSAAPPFLILHGQADTLIPVSQSWYLFEALAEAGNDVALVLLQNLKHGFFNNPKLTREEYGTLTVYRSPANRRAHANLSCDSIESVQSIVSNFFRIHLNPKIPSKTVNSSV